MKILVYLTLAVYFAFYLFEGPVRYALNMVGADSLIFIRDALLALTIMVIFLKQFISRNVHPAFIVFALVIAVHGAVTILNIKSIFVVLYCIKLLMSLLAGAILAPYLMQPHKNVVKIVFVFWAVTFVAVFLDKYYVQFPWTGLETTIGDIQVELARDWTITGADKRAAGLMRSSIYAAIIEPLLAFILIFNIRKLIPCLIIMVMTTMTLYWTTQKASIIGFVLTSFILLIAARRPVPLLKIGISAAFLLMIFLPIILPHFIMPNAGGQFSMSSFYMRVEDVWPRAWSLIEKREAFPFGIGLGGIGGAQRLYDPSSGNSADNMYIYLYAYFGVLSYLYMGWLWWSCMRVSNKAAPDVVMALSIIFFLVFYGIAMSMIDDQMATLFLGAAATWIVSKNKSSKLA